MEKIIWIGLQKFRQNDYWIANSVDIGHWTAYGATDEDAKEKLRLAIAQDYPGEEIILRETNRNVDYC